MGPIFSLIRLYSPALEIIDGVMCEGWISVALKDKKKDTSHGYYYRKNTVL